MSLTHLADPSILPTLLEAAMLICFGVAWPLANLRMLRSGRAEGKGAIFTAIILCGYVAGALAKLALASDGHTLPPVFWLYALNTVSVGGNLLLQWCLARRPAAPIALATAGCTCAARRRLDGLARCRPGAPVRAARRS